MARFDPKEKAQEMYNSMKGFRVTNVHRKKCARVAIEKIIDNLVELSEMTSDVFIKGWLGTEAGCWEDVKNELEKL